MSDPLKTFWAWVGGATTLAFGFLTRGLILKDQQGAANVLNAGANAVGTTVGAFAKVGT